METFFLSVGMVKTRSMTRNHNHDDDASSSSRKKRFKTYDHGGVAPWLEPNHDLLFLVMMQLGVVDFLSFSGVCKSWRSLALLNKSRFMASRPPMSMWISNDANEKECYCFLEDFKGKKFKTLLPHSTYTKYIRLTCGYLVMLCLKTNDYWLVNPITKHELHFPAVPYISNFIPFRAILVFSPSLSRWLFVLIQRFSRLIWFSIVGTGAWNHVSSTFFTLDLHAFQGKIYILNERYGLCEMSLSPEPKLTLLEIRNFPKRCSFILLLVSSDENLYVIDHDLEDSIQELDFGEMIWVSPKEKAIREHAFFRSYLMCWTAIKPESWDGPHPQYNKYDCFLHTTEKCEKGKFFSSSMWYFPHDCLNVDLINK
ncbi:unnamed protein product [Lactuca virosa]|uniref:F-box domain-containing protein n=1 Tax=Lactuca virosa TaxID=75947 RepID=A0AAU9N939_9ASTR|nr:unnamed protein product [Lactuca virosa]